ncbi:peptidyl-tRNA hydrolase [Sodiomyces alkalinus F11]|uniref:peptidyl-tRNA hydrolase n=1 Tax=Sodiomyces alkalinus (strain CBS 110278 / VKM F-3762 / F11) TaxID=1314773 RepID=A0A3N2Q9I1_SODAK|nr:peptidyl-tRNA hydrolase [Sodiomyces alkalinus F11]ROT43402.1 peptidyl-tRNA hydrolase [Sodiomyces alkalinus F11]
MADQLHIILTTSSVAFITGFGLGVYAIRGYLISPELTAERDGNLKDPVESDESDIDESDTILDHAPNWANGEAADRRDGLRQAAAVRRTPTVVDNGNEECKLVLVVRTDLGMTKGKIAAQCSHATLACYKSLSRAAAKNGPSSPEARILNRWEKLGQAKIAVQTKNEEELRNLRKTAWDLGVTAEVIADAGRTQIEAGSLTVLGVGPAPRSLVDKVTGHLKLL